MTPAEHERLTAARTGWPARGVQVTARRGVWRRSHTPWRLFETTVTIAASVTGLDDQEVRLAHGDIRLRVLLGDVAAVTDASFLELARPLSLEEALGLAFNTPAVTA